MLTLLLIQLASITGLMILGIHARVQLKKCRWELWATKLDYRRVREYNKRLMAKAKAKEKDHTIRKLEDRLRTQPSKYPKEFFALMDKVLTIIRSGPVTTSQIYSEFSRHIKAHVLQTVLANLKEEGLIKCEKVKTSGRSSKIWSIRIEVPKLQENK